MFGSILAMEFFVDTVAGPRQTTYPAEDISGTVYDIQTEAGNYFADGVLRRAGE